MNKVDLLGILDSIYDQGEASRTELAEKSGFAPSYISALVSELRSRNLVTEGGRSPSRAGRRRVLLNVAPDLAHLVGIRIGRANTRVVVTDFNGKVLSLKRVPTETSLGKDRVFSLIERELAAAIESDPLIKGIGVAMSGVIDRNSGTRLFWPKVPGWNDVPIRQHIEKTFGLPVVLEDTVRTMALAEEKFGDAKGRKNFVYVIVSMGIGAAIYINNRLYLGRTTSPANSATPQLMSAESSARAGTAAVWRFTPPVGQSSIASRVDWGRVFIQVCRNLETGIRIRSRLRPSSMPPNRATSSPIRCFGKPACT